MRSRRRMARYADTRSPTTKATADSAQATIVAATVAVVVIRPSSTRPIAKPTRIAGASSRHGTIGTSRYGRITSDAHRIVARQGCDAPSASGADVVGTG